MVALKKVESLRTFLDFGSERAHVNQFPPILCLRALHTRSCSVLTSMKALTHLRYLSLCWVLGANLQNSICGLQKLQILKLEYCKGQPNLLPKDLTQLQDLRHIVINECISIGQMPQNISKLRHLRTLSTFVVGSKAGYGLAELHDLRLGDRLHIRGLENVASELDARQANLMSKKDLNRLHLSWVDSANSEGRIVNVERVLEALKPPSTLKSFRMKGYRGIVLPSWMRNTSILRDLVDVMLYDCENCEELPSLGKLPHLKSLSLSGMKNVKWIDGESYDDVEKKAFPSLEELSMEYLPNLERMLRDEEVEMLPRLSSLTIKGVSNIKFPCLPSAEHLDVSFMDETASLMEGVVENMPCLKTLYISSIKGMLVLPDQLSRLNALQELSIVRCDDVEYFPEHVLEGLTSLRTLSISWCKKLKSLSEGVAHLACLESLTLRWCSELVALPRNMSQLTALRKVSISLTLPEGLQHIPSLQSLEISDCECTSLPEWLGDMTSLQELAIIGCEELRSVPSSFQRLTNLSKLSIKYCPHLEKRCKRETGEDWQHIAHIPKFQMYFSENPRERTSTFCESIRRSSCSWNCFNPTRGLEITMDEFDEIADY